MTAVPKIKRYQSEKYLEFIRAQPCLVCGQKSEPHHLLSRGSGGSDLYCINLCRKCHSEIEQIGRNKFCLKYNWANDIYFKDEMLRLLMKYIQLIEAS